MPKINPIPLMAIVVAMIVVLFPGTFQTAQGTTVTPVVSPTVIKVSFKLDPRITRGMFMGERWVSPPTYALVQQKDQKLIVYARAVGYDAQGRPMEINPTWKAANTEVVQVSPLQGQKVQLIVLKEGSCDLTVRHGKLSKKLSVKAVLNQETLRVNISQ